MKIELEFDTNEIGEERLAALSREALRRRVPLDQLIKDEFRKLADALVGTSAVRGRTKAA